MLMTKELRVYDEGTDSIKIARYCPNEDSIWKEDQSEISKVEPIVLETDFSPLELTSQTLESSWTFTHPT